MVTRSCEQSDDFVGGDNDIVMNLSRKWPQAVCPGSTGTGSFICSCQDYFKRHNDIYDYNEVDASLRLAIIETLEARLSLHAACG